MFWLLLGVMQQSQTDADFRLFFDTLAEAKERHPIRILAYCIMSNHWHLVLYPAEDGQLVPFMQWLTMTHTHRWHAAHETIGTGHLYQGRYKSFPVQQDEHFLQLVRYVVRNPLRAKLVRRAEKWPWSSLYTRVSGTKSEKKVLDAWPMAIPKNYRDWVNAPQTVAELDVIRTSVSRGRPLGHEVWMDSMAERLQLQSSFRKRGRPKKRS